MDKEDKLLLSIIARAKMDGEVNEKHLNLLPVNSNAEIGDKYMAWLQSFNKPSFITHTTEANKASIDVLVALIKAYSNKKKSLNHNSPKPWIRKTKNF